MHKLKNKRFYDAANSVLSKEQQLEIIENYLNGQQWTPVVGVLLVCGYHAELDIKEIPIADNYPSSMTDEERRTYSKQFDEANRLLAQWQDWADDRGVDPDITSKIEAVDFLNWCFDEEVKSPWLNLFIGMIVGAIPNVTGRIDADFVEID